MLFNQPVQPPALLSHLSPASSYTPHSLPLLGGHCLPPATATASSSNLQQRLSLMVATAGGGGGWPATVAAACLPPVAAQQLAAHRLPAYSQYY